MRTPQMQWCKMQRLSPRPQRFTDLLREQVFSDHAVTNGLLCELALFFLIYTVRGGGRRAGGRRPGTGACREAHGIARVLAWASAWMPS